MRIAQLAVACLILATCVVARADAPGPEFVGTWQFQTYFAWVRIDDDGSAWQCRIDPNGTLITSTGRFVAPDTIAWDDIWGTDTITAVTGAIRLSGQYGEFEFADAAMPMADACEAARPPR